MKTIYLRIIQEKILRVSAGIQIIHRGIGKEKIREGSFLILFVTELIQIFFEFNFTN